MKLKRVLLLFLIVFLFAACGKDSIKENVEADEDKESVVFRQIDIVTKGDEVTITGEVKSWDGNFYYYVLSGEEVILKEEKIEMGNVHFWSPFEIVLSKSELLELTEDIPHIVLHGKNGKDEKIHPNYVPIDLTEKE